MSVLAATFLNGGRLWWLLAVAALGAGYVATQLWGRRATVRFTQVDLLDRVAPSRPGWRRHVIAALMLLGLASGVVAIARPVDRTTVRERSEGRILVVFDVSLADLLAKFGFTVTSSTPFAEVLNVTLPRVGALLPFLMLVLILVFRPRGLMGTRDT